MKIDISPYFREKSSYFDEILYTAANFELDKGHVIKNEEVALDRLRVPQNVFLVMLKSQNVVLLLPQNVIVYCTDERFLRLL